MTDKITSLAGLRKAIRKIQNYTEIERQVIELISEFEAGVRERITFLERDSPYVNPNWQWSELCARLAELRRVLGEGVE